MSASGPLLIVLLLMVAIFARSSQIYRVSAKIQLLSLRVFIGFAHIPAELRWLVSPFARPSFPIFPTRRALEGGAWRVWGRDYQKTTYRFIMVCTDLPAAGQKSLTHWTGYPGFQKKKFHTHTSKPAEVEPGSERSAYPLQNYVCFSLLTSGLDSFGHKSTPSDRPWIEANCPKF